MLLFRQHNQNEDFDFDILWYEKSYGNILICDISYKTSSAAKPTRIRFDKIDGFIRVYDGTRYILLLDPKKMMPTAIGLDILQE